MDIIILYSKHLGKTIQSIDTDTTIPRVFFMKGENENERYMEKIMLFAASFAMIFSSVFSNIAIPVHAASNETTFFEVNKADDVINEAKKHLGKPYVWGAAGPNSFDCSGYVSYVLKKQDYL